MVGPDNPVFVVAEAGCNHQGDPELGFRLIDAAKEAGCDCVKFQAFRAELTVPPEGLDAIRPLEFDMRSIVMMKHYTEKNNMVFLCTPFDTWSVDMLADIGSYAYKISSGDVTNIPLLQRIAAKKLPVILSTGMANMVEIEYALRALEGVPVVLTQCTSLYPAEPWQANLRAMESMQAAFGVPVGLSDHTLGTAVPLAAVAMGACVIEKHITLDRGMAGPDHAMSMATSELTNFVDAIRAVESARGTGYKAPCDDEAHAKLYYRRGIYAWCDIAAGELFTDGNVFARRPEAEMKPDKLPGLYGKAASRAYKTGDAICE
jgi:N-acetylneuraminate synthase/N,N'-diacetyllegionaminate synthase